MRFSQGVKKTINVVGRQLLSMLLCLLLALSCTGLMTGCGGKSDAEQSKVTQVKSDYTAAQMYVLMGSMRKVVADSYTEDVFTAVVDGAGDTYDDKFLGIMRDYMEKLTLMKAMISERGLSLTSDEEKAVGKLADSYMEELKGAATAGTLRDISRDDVVKILTDQMLIPKLREDIMGGSEIEISESEARVMDISMIVVTSSDKASEAMTQITDGKDFAEVAEGYTTQEEIEVKVCREDLPKTIADTVFDLEDGEVSPVMQSEGKYYIIKCNVGYDVEETAVRKAQLTRERRRESVGTAYREFCTDHECAIDDETWTAAVELYRADGSIPDVYAYMDED